MAAPSELGASELGAVGRERFLLKFVTDPMPGCCSTDSIEEKLPFAGVGINQGTGPKSSRHKRLEAIV